MTETPATSEVRTIAYGVRSLTIQNFGLTVLGFIFLAFLLRLLSPFQYGIYSAVFVSYTVSSTIAAFGLQYAAARFVAQLKSYDLDESRKTAKTIFVIAIIFSLFASAVFGALSPTLSIFFTKSMAAAPSFFIGAALVFAGSMSLVFQGFCQGLKRYSLLAEMLLASRALMLALTIVALIFFKNAAIPILGWIGYNAIIVFWSLKAVGKETAIHGSTRGYSFSSVFAYTLPLGIAGILNIIANNIDQILVGGYLNSVSLGIYNAAVTISTALGIVLFAPINTAFLPEASSRTNSIEAIASGLRLAIRFVVLLTVPISFIFTGLSLQLMEVFSGSNHIYTLGTTSLQILSLLFVFVPLQGLLSSLLQAIGQTVKAMTVGIVQVASVLSASVILIPMIGIAGAALSNAFLSIAGFLVALYFTRNYLGQSKDYRFYAKVLLGSFAALIVLLALTGFALKSEYSLIPYSIIGFAVFLFSLKLTNALSEADKRYISHIIPAALARYLRYL
jgi:lipopolysaccharide exporter